MFWVCSCSNVFILFTSLIVEASILWEQRGEVLVLVFFLTWSKKKSAAEREFVRVGGWGLIHTQHYHFDGFDAVFGGSRGRGVWAEWGRKGESAFIGSSIFTPCRKEVVFHHGVLLYLHPKWLPLSITNTLKSVAYFNLRRVFCTFIIIEWDYRVLLSLVEWL